MTAGASQKIGEINGKWAMMFKVHLAVGSIVLPALLGWGIWVTSHQFADNWLRQDMRGHTAIGGHAVMDQRMLMVEARIVSHDQSLAAIEEKLDRLLVAVTEIKATMANGNGE